jgi:hypothetical protein
MRIKYVIKLKIQIILGTLHEMPVLCRLKEYVTIRVLDIIHCPIFLTQRSGDRIMSPSSGGTYLDGPNRNSQSLSPDTSNGPNRVYKVNSTQTPNES